MVRKYIKSVNEKSIRDRLDGALLVAEINNLNRVMLEGMFDYECGKLIPTLYYNMIGYKPKYGMYQEGHIEEFNHVVNICSKETQEILEEMGIVDELNGVWNFSLGYDEQGNFGLVMYKRGV